MLKKYMVFKLDKVVLYREKQDLHCKILQSISSGYQDRYIVILGHINGLHESGYKY